MSLSRLFAQEHVSISPSSSSSSSSSIAPSMAAPQSLYEAEEDILSTPDLSSVSDNASEYSSSSDRSSDICLTSVNPVDTMGLSLSRSWMATLIPKHLWKDDASSLRCDTPFCRKKFTVLERRHHCRKCGGIFCHQCSANTVPLLDTTHLGFSHPPRNTPISRYASPTSPIVKSRVCTDCHAQLHGLSSPSPTAAASACDSLPTRPPMLRRHSSEPDNTSTPRVQPRKSRSTPSPLAPLSPETPTAGLAWPILGNDLDHYPLRIPSAKCKALGGGRWEPKPIVVPAGYRVPGGKAAFEIEMEREEEERMREKLNPIIRDGDIQVRAARPPHVETYARCYVPSTF